MIWSAVFMFAVAHGSSVAAAAIVGESAPGFSLVDSKGETRSLAGFKGHFVVLEWVNFNCPFVGKHYGSGHMQQLQKTYTAKGVVWLSVNSSAPGKDGNFSPAEIEKKSKERGAAPTAYLIDADGAVGRAYGAKTTPHMFVINEKGVLVYKGALDNAPFGQSENNEAHINYVEAALADLGAGRAVTKAETKSYG
jgi:peroxiredoxin